MGVLQRFERRLGGLVEGAFARAFKSELQPAELARAIQRELDDRAAIVAQDRILVPNDFIVAISPADYERLSIYEGSLGVEFAGMAREHAGEQGYSFVGPVGVRFEQDPALDTGRFHLRSGVVRGTTVEGGELRRPADGQRAGPAGPSPTNPRLLVSPPEATGDDGENGEHAFEVTAPVTVLGRGTDCDLRLVDSGVSRHHAELRFEDDEVVLIDLGSTNGTLVDGWAASRTPLRNGARIEMGHTVLVFRRGEVER